MDRSFDFILAGIALIVGIPEKEMHQEINTKIKQGMGDKNLPCLFCLREFIKKY